eukprot:4796120-Amphidinium_carterae.1
MGLQWLVDPAQAAMKGLDVASGLGLVDVTSRSEAKIHVRKHLHSLPQGLALIEGFQKFSTGYQKHAAQINEACKKLSNQATTLSELELIISIFPVWKLEAVEAAGRIEASLLEKLQALQDTFVSAGAASLSASEAKDVQTLTKVTGSLAAASPENQKLKVMYGGM